MKNTFQTRIRQTMAALVALTLVLSVLGPIGTVAAAPTVSVSQTVDSTTVNPGDTVTVTTTVSTTEVNGPLLQYDLPDGWMGEVTDAAGGFKKPTSGTSNTPEVLWLGAGEYVVTLEVQVPSDATATTYDIVADLSAVDPLDDEDDVPDEPYESSSTTTTITVEEPTTPTPANFQVSSLNPTDVTVTQGDVIDVSATVENTGDEAGTQSVEFRVDGTPLGSQDVTLAGGESQSVTFSNIDTSALAPDTYTHGVYTEDDSQTATLTVEAVPSSKSTDVTLSPTTAETTVGNTETFNLVVENADGGVGAYTATVSLDDPTVATITDVQVTGDPGLLDFTYAPDGSSVTINSALGNTANTGAVTIATVVVTGQSEGTANLAVDVSALGDELGNSYTVTSTGGAALTVVDLQPLGDFQNPPSDMNGDGMYEDTNGDGVFNIVDIQATFANLNDPVLANNVEKFDYNQDGVVNVVDVQAQYNMLLNGGL